MIIPSRLASLGKTFSAAFAVTLSEQRCGAGEEISRVLANERLLSQDDASLSRAIFQGA